uniref:ADP-ribosylation factor GTPase-activating protein 3 n=1 Tax=Arundo donax TaxID=35708 RepID=A0A0A8XQP9_ARUDO
MESNGAGN